MLETKRDLVNTGSDTLRAPSDPGDLAFISGILSRQRSLIFKAVLVGLGLGLLVLTLSAPTFKSVAVLLVDFKRLAVVDEDFSTTSGRIDSSAVLSQLELVTSQNVIRRVVVAEKLDEDPEFVGSPGLVSRLLSSVGVISATGQSPADRLATAVEAVQKHVVGARVDLSYAISVTFSAHTSEKAARLANAIAQAYIDDELDAKRIASDKASQWFSERILQLQKDVTDADRQVIAFRLANNIVTSDGKFIQEQQLSDFAQKLLQATVARSDSEAKVAQLEKIVKSGSDSNALVDEFSNAVIIELRNELLAQGSVAADLANRYGESHIAVIQARAKVAQLQKAVADELGRIYQAARTELSIDQEQEKTLKGELDTLSDRSNQAREAQARLSQLQGASDAVKTIRDTFMSRYVDGIQKQSFPMTEARIISLAQPTSATFPTPFKTLGLGAVLGFGIGFVLGAANEAFSRRARFSRQLRTITQNTFLGYLPRLSAGGSSDAAVSIGGNPANSVYVETLRRIKIDLDASRGSIGSIVGFLSSAPGEGVSFTAFNFAKRCAADGKRTLLLDCNLRNQRLSEWLAPNRTAGLAEVAAGVVPLSDTLVAVGDVGVNFLPAHRTSASASPDGLLSSEAFRKLLARVVEDYHYVILDLPALGSVADGRAVAEFVDAFVMIVEWNRTSDHVLNEVIRNNQIVARKMIGSVFNKARLKDLIKSGELSSHMATAYDV